MLFGPHNFLTHVKFLVMGGGRNSNNSPALDAGYLVDYPLNILSDLRTAGGLTLTAATAPTVAATETNGVSVVGAASTTALGTFNFQVPRDYDENTDTFNIHLLAAMAGATNTPTVNATIYNKRTGAALSADLAPTASAAVTGTAAAAYVIVSNSKGLKANDVLTINLVSGAHTTDAFNLYGVHLSYRSTLVSYQAQDSAGVDLR